MHHQFNPRSEARNVGDLRASPSKQRYRRPFGICSMLSHNACSGGKTGFTCTEILGSGATPLSNAQRQVSLVRPSPQGEAGERLGRRFLSLIPGCGSLRAHSIYILSI